MTNLHYQEYGQGQPLVILHGLLGSSDNWSRLSRLLGEHFNVIAVDLRNHGYSQHMSTMSYDDMASDVCAFIQNKHMYNPHILGHSMGAKVAMKIADIAEFFSL